MSKRHRIKARTRYRNALKELAENAGNSEPKGKYVRQPGRGAMRALRKEVESMKRAELLLLGRAAEVKRKAADLGGTKADRDMYKQHHMAKLETQLSFLNYNVMMFARNRGIPIETITKMREELDVQATH